MSSRRIVQVARLLKEELSDLLRRELKDPRAGFITLTEVEVSPDLRNARVFFSVLGDDEAVQRSQQALESAAGFLRHELGRRIKLRRIPQLQFELDRSAENSQHIADLLHQVLGQEE
jgi:ribosome-binding factor A